MGGRPPRLRTTGAGEGDGEGLSAVAGGGLKVAAEVVARGAGDG